MSVDDAVTKSLFVGLFWFVSSSVAMLSYHISTMRNLNAISTKLDALKTKLDALKKD